MKVSLNTNGSPPRRSTARVACWAGVRARAVCTASLTNATLQSTTEDLT